MAIIKPVNWQKIPEPMFRIFFGIADGLGVWSIETRVDTEGDGYFWKSVDDKYYSTATEAAAALSISC